MSAPRPAEVFSLGLIALGAKKALERIVEMNHTTGAPGLARLLLGVAGSVYRPQRKRWEADLQYMQQTTNESGLLLAASCLLSSPWLIFRHAPHWIWEHVRKVDRESPPGLLIGLAVGIGFGLVVGVVMGLVSGVEAALGGRLNVALRLGLIDVVCSLGIGLAYGLALGLGARRPGRRHGPSPSHPYFWSAW
ncbi:MAG: hypothetical protein ACRDJF_10055 [Actinomycetota bacterium]